MNLDQLFGTGGADLTRMDKAAEKELRRDASRDAAARPRTDRRIGRRASKAARHCGCGEYLVALGVGWLWLLASSCVKSQQQCFHTEGRQAPRPPPFPVRQSLDCGAVDEERLQPYGCGERCRITRRTKKERAQARGTVKMAGRSFQGISGHLQGVSGHRLRTRDWAAST